jgi:hypothetical protein
VEEGLLTVDTLLIVSSIRRNLNTRSPDPDSVGCPTENHTKPPHRQQDSTVCSRDAFRSDPVVNRFAVT